VGKDLHEKLVLVVDDDPAVLDLVRLVVQELVGAQTAVAHHGHQAVSLALHQRPSLILLDVRLPDLSGVEVVRALKVSPATRLIPVVVLASLAQDRQQALAAGADGFLDKPFELVDLVEQVRQYLGRDAPTRQRATERV
jgi:CheY-like chemotaxis protein